MTNNPVFTVGHSNHSDHHFITLLQASRIQVLADVRSHPFSKYASQFNQDNLKRSLSSKSICYEFFGNGLGARPKNPDCYVNGNASYALIKQSTLFMQELENIIAISQQNSIALMCSEKEPLDCHRTILISQILASRGIKVRHIHFDGHIEPHAEAMTRLLRIHGLEPDLFHSFEEQINLACAIQEKKISYHDSKQETA